MSLDSRLPSSWVGLAWSPKVAETKQFGEPGMHLLGFKAVASLLPHHRIFHSYFVYPNERAVKGSSALCQALIDTMLERKKMAVIRYVARALFGAAVSDDSTIFFDFPLVVGIHSSKVERWAYTILFRPPCGRVVEVELRLISIFGAQRLYAAC